MCSLYTFEYSLYAHYGPCHASRAVPSPAHHPTSPPDHHIPPVQTYKTPVVLEEQNPQYRYKMDFVNITAASTLTLTVYERPSMLAKAVGKIPLMKKVRNGTASHGHGPGRCHAQSNSAAVLMHPWMTLRTSCQLLASLQRIAGGGKAAGVRPGTCG